MKLSVKVTCHSTITVRCILYTVPSRLIGQRLTIYLYHDHLLGICRDKTGGGVASDACA